VFNGYQGVLCGRAGSQRHGPVLDNAFLSEGGVVGADGNDNPVADYRFW
jgi:hypothetical protein